MKQITLHIKETKFKFFMELIQNLDFVNVEDDADSKESIKQNIIDGLGEVKLAKQGKLRTTSAKEFLNEL
ncbi:MAG: hypothetical protein K9G46_06715 [Flavobacteriales bacterium]|jgi:hypothetical protein|nr:hypothetical protein [Flavobacteriales bacterium]